MFATAFVVKSDLVLQVVRREDVHRLPGARQLAADIHGDVEHFAAGFAEGCLEPGAFRTAGGKLLHRLVHCMRDFKETVHKVPQR